MQILVTGATGNVGGGLASVLQARGIPFVAGVRPCSPEVDGMPTVPLDFEDPRTWDAALEGVDRLFLVRPPAISDVGPTLNAFVDHGAAQLAHIVFLSVAGAEKNTFIPHAKVEAHLRAGSVPWTFLRASFFAQNLCGAYREDIRDDDRLFVPAGHAGVSWVGTRDLGEAAANAFTDPDAREAAWTLTGRETRTFDEVAALLSRHLDRPIRYARPSVLRYLWHLRRRGLPWGAASVYAVLHTAIRFGAEDRLDPTLGRVLGRPPRTIEDTIRDHLPLWRRGSPDPAP
jgi:uncharacterized protein YbjT (DUF2867 family)